jgi:hypothetical protein
MNAQSFRCPACHKLSYDETARGAHILRKEADAATPRGTL